MSEITRLVDAAASGDRKAAADLLPLVYDELRKLAAARMSQESPGHTLNPTALVHEAYLRLVGDQQFHGRGHFFAAAAEAMRRVLVNHARDRNRLKRAGGRIRLELLDQAGSLVEDPDLVLSLDELLTRLGAEDAAAARIAHLHLFGGLSVEEAGVAAGSHDRSPIGTGSTPGPGSATPSQNNPKSARHFSPGRGIEGRSPLGGVAHGRRSRPCEVPVPGRVRPAQSGGPSCLPGPRVRR